MVGFDVMSCCKASNLISRSEFWACGVVVVAFNDDEDDCKAWVIVIDCLLAVGATVEKEALSFEPSVIDSILLSEGEVWLVLLLLLLLIDWSMLFVMFESLLVVVVEDDDEVGADEEDEEEEEDTEDTIEAFLSESPRVAPATTAIWSTEPSSLSRSRGLSPLGLGIGFVGTVGGGGGGWSGLRFKLKRSSRLPEGFILRGEFDSIMVIWLNS